MEKKTTLTGVAPIKETPSQTSCVADSQSYHLLNKCFIFPNLDQEDWWNRTGPVLGKLLADAKYDVQHQFQYMCFYALNVIPLLGPFKPSRTPGGYESTIGSRIGPLELSQNFTRERCIVRMNFEATNQAANSGRDQTNRTALDEAVAKFKLLGIGMNSDLYHALRNAFLVTDEEEKLAAKEMDLRNYPCKTQHNMSLDFKDGNIMAKLYLYPRLKSMVTNKPKEDIILDAVRQVVGGTCDHSLEMIEKFFKTLPPSMDVELLSCDLIDPKKSRFKIYVFDLQVDFESLTRIWTIGGQLNDPETLNGLSLLKELWEALNIPAGTRKMPDRVNREGDPPDRVPVCANYEILPGKKWPQPKIYLPTLGISDKVIADGLTNFFGKHGYTELAKSYSQQISSLIPMYMPGSEIEASTDFQAWVSFAYTEKTGPYTTIYYH
ncbi:tryptophan dimethylallyltransferase [Histoplasma capsulatum G186AR]|uniref:Tryptophan dimethylallyltransferase n=2 Tax=Ajellomyces capsulatus TaxID=5037 RepID=C0NW91_AJECG|nr:tryptophan dimethylallyltransferase [Histoplasma capsulatum G186AR]EEH04196.1 tryptophan dimethylallyltransferase [Histoplasma capsulatum G186AR]KAG5291145.1 tryptophan dimethylallyltransferase [Histoplasma capsulatum]QSS68448.1 tryptophan dimethylallyltransferase [Histoplasma capsulatum G186AR]